MSGRLPVSFSSASHRNSSQSVSDADRPIEPGPRYSIIIRLFESCHLHTNSHMKACGGCIGNDRLLGGFGPTKTERPTNLLVCCVSIFGIRLRKVETRKQARHVSAHSSTSTPISCLRSLPHVWSPSDSCRAPTSQPAPNVAACEMVPDYVRREALRAPFEQMAVETGDSGGHQQMRISRQSGSERERAEDSTLLVDGGRSTRCSVMPSTRTRTKHKASRRQDEMKREGYSAFGSI